MLDRLRNLGRSVGRLDPKHTTPTEPDKVDAGCGVIRKEALLPDELNTIDFTQDDRKKRSAAIKAQLEMDEMVLNEQTAVDRLEPDFDPVPETLRDLPDDEEMYEFWEIKQDGLIKSQEQIVVEYLNKAVEANKKDFMLGIRTIEEIDSNLSRSIIFLQNARRKLKDSKETITTPRLSIAYRSRRESRMTAVIERMEKIRALMQMEGTLLKIIESGNIVEGVSVANEIQTILRTGELAQYHCLDRMRGRVEDMWPNMKAKLIELLREQLRHFDSEEYSNLFRAHAILESHMEVIYERMEKEAAARAQIVAEEQAAKQKQREEQQQQADQERPSLTPSDSTSELLGDRSLSAEHLLGTPQTPATEPMTPKTGGFASRLSWKGRFSVLTPKETPLSPTPSATPSVSTALDESIEGEDGEEEGEEEEDEEEDEEEEEEEDEDEDGDEDEEEPGTEEENKPESESEDESQVQTKRRESYSDLVQKCSTQLITQETERVLREFLLTEGSQNDKPKDVLEQMNFLQLCTSLRVSDVPKATRRLMEAMLNVLHSHYLISQWHREPFDPRNNDRVFLHRCNVRDNETEELGINAELGADGTPLNEGNLRKYKGSNGVTGETLFNVRKELAASRKVIWVFCQRIMNDCIECSKLDNTNTHLSKIIALNDLCIYFSKVGEVFCGSTSLELEQKLRVKECSYIHQLHLNNIEALKSSFETEMWQPFPLKLAEMNGFPGLLASTLVIPPEDDMFLRSSQTNILEVFTNFESEGNSFEHGRKLQLLKSPLPDIFNKIDNTLVLTGVCVNTFIKSVGRYLDIMSSLPLTANYVFLKLSQLADYYIYTVYTQYSPASLQEEMFVENDDSFPLVIGAVKRVMLFMDRKDSGQDPSDEKSIEKLFLKRSTAKIDGQVPRALFVLDEQGQADVNIRRLVAAESTRVIHELFVSISSRLKHLTTVTTLMPVQAYLAQLPQVINELCVAFYRTTADALLPNSEDAKASLLKQKWELKSAKERECEYLETLKEDIENAWNTLKEALSEGRITSLCVQRMWRNLVSAIMCVMLGGFVDVKKATNEGRDQMSIDTQMVYDFACTFHDVIIGQDSRDVKYVTEYTNICKQEEVPVILEWMKKNKSTYTMYLMESVVNNGAAKKFNKQKTKELKDGMSEIFQDEAAE